MASLFFSPRLTRAQINEAGEKQRGEDIEQPVCLAKFSGDQMQDSPSDQSQS